MVERNKGEAPEIMVRPLPEVLDRIEELARDALEAVEQVMLALQAAEGAAEAAASSAGLARAAGLEAARAATEAAEKAIEDTRRDLLELIKAGDERLNSVAKLAAQALGRADKAMALALVLSEAIAEVLNTARERYNAKIESFNQAYPA